MDKKETASKSTLTTEKIEKYIGIAKKTYDKYSCDWNLHLDYYNGKQWKAASYDKGDLVDNDGNLLWDLRDTNYNKNPALPKRTRNIIWTTLETEVGLLTELNPTVRAIPMISDDNTRDATLKLDLFFKEIFNKNFRKEYNKLLRDVCIYGLGYFHIHFDSKATANNKVPFSLRREKPRNIKAEGQAEDWSGVRWAVRDFKMMQYEVKAKFPKWEGESNTEVITLTEIWVRKNVLDSSATGWVKAIVYDNEVLQEIDMPINPIECFRMYPGDGWWGISEIKNIKEEQDIINKRLSQEEFYINMKVFPPVTVDKEVDLEPGKLPYYPGKGFKSTRTGQPSIIPMHVEDMPMSDFMQSQASAEQAIENITGISKAAQGRNEKGVYTGKHFQAVMDSVLTRVKNKDKLLSSSIENLARKIIKWAIEDIKDSGSYKVYDPINHKDLELTVEDFKAIRDFDLVIETTDANLLTAGERVEMLKGLSQYGLDPQMVGVAISEQIPGLLPQEYIEVLKENITMKQELESARLRAETSKQQLEQEKVGDELDNINNPPEQPMPQQGVPQPGMQEQPMPEQQPSDEDETFRQLIEQITQQLIQTGISPEEANAKVQQAVQQLDPAATLPDKVNQLQQILGNAQA